MAALPIVAETVRPWPSHRNGPAFRPATLRPEGVARAPPGHVTGWPVRRWNWRARWGFANHATSTATRVDNGGSVARAI